MKYKPPTKEQVAKVATELKPLGFVGSGELSMIFTHTSLNMDFDFSAISLDKVRSWAVCNAFHRGVNKGYDGAQERMRESLGL